MARTKNRGRGPKQKIRDADRRRQALLLRREGRTYDEIAKALGLKQKCTAHQLVTKALADLWMEPAQDVRKLELERLDRMLLGLVADPTFDEHGRVVSGGAMHGCPTAVGAVVKIQERRARYLGLDTPSKYEHTGKDGGPLAMLDLTKLSDDELERIARCGTAADVAPGPSGARTPEACTNGVSGFVHPAPDPEVGDS